MGSHLSGASYRSGISEGEDARRGGRERGGRGGEGFRVKRRSGVERARAFDRMEKIESRELDSNVGLVFVRKSDGPQGVLFVDGLVRMYAELKAKGSATEFVFVCLDESEDVFLSLTSRMPWLAIPFWEDERRRRLAKRCLKKAGGGGGGEGEGGGTPVLVMWSDDASSITDRVGVDRVRVILDVAATRRSKRVGGSPSPSSSSMTTMRSPRVPVPASGSRSSLSRNGSGWLPIERAISGTSLHLQ